MLARRFCLYASPGTADFLIKNGLKIIKAYKSKERKKPQILELIENKQVELVINISRKRNFTFPSKSASYEGYLIRRKAVDFNIPLITNLENAITFTKAMSQKKLTDLKIKSWDEYR